MEVRNLLAQALDDERVHLGHATTARLAARLTELLDREQRHQARRDRAADALYIGKET